MNQETNEMLEIYCNTNLNQLEPEEIKLLKKDLEIRKRQLDTELENLYENNKISDSGKISMMETMMTELDNLLGEIAEILQEPIQEELPEEIEESDTEEVGIEEIQQEELEQEVSIEEIEKQEELPEEVEEEKSDTLESEEPEEIQIETVEIEEVSKTTIELKEPSQEYIQKVIENRKNENVQQNLLEAITEGEKVANSLMKKLQLL